MLRITYDATETTVTLKIEGKLRGPWVYELHKQFDGAGSNGRTKRLDLAGVSFVDDAGASLLRELLKRGVQIAACSSFVSQLLEAETT